MKKIMFFLFVMAFTFSSCSSSVSTMPDDYIALDYVILPDYMACEIPAEDMEITEEEITLSIRMELQLMGVYDKKNNDTVETDDIVVLTLKYVDEEEVITVWDSEEYYIGTEEYIDFEKQILGRKTGEQFSFKWNLNRIPGFKNKDKEVYVYIYIENICVPILDLTEDIAYNYFDGKTIQEVRELFAVKIQNWRKWDIIEQYLLENTIIKGAPVQKDIYVKREMEFDRKYAASKGISFDEYLDSIGYTETEYQENIEQFYYEMMLYKALAEREGLICSDKEFQEKLLELSEGLRMSEKEVLEEYGEEYIYYIYRYDNLKEIIPQELNLNNIKDEE